jgi:serine/threonine-protein kinase
MYTAIEQATPSLVLAARDPVKAVDLSDVNVTIDGLSVTDHLDGKPVSVDPGAHTLVFTASKYVPEERKLLIGAGEKYRQVSVTLTSTDAPPAGAAATPVAAAATPPAPLAPRTVPVASYVLGGVGLAAIGGGILFRVLGANQYNSLQSSCSPDCTSSQVDPVKAKYTISNVAFGVGAAALVGAVVVYAVTPRESAPSTAFMVVPTAGGASARLLSTF